VEPHRLAILPRPTILIADDHSDFRDALTVLLEHEGYRVADANNGAEALAYLRSGAPVNALIVDLDMPVMNGWDFIAACRANATWRTIPTLVVTGVSIADRSRAEVADNTTIVTKPFNFDDLVANLRRVMIREVPKPNVG
jgi:CheY-like chemotaxis protein